MTHPDDRRYMTHEQRAADDPRYRGKATSEGGTARTCACGKTVYYSANGAVVSDRCPRDCDSGRNPN